VKLALLILIGTPTSCVALLVLVRILCGPLASDSTREIK
jgi:hypothetical protein